MPKMRGFRGTGAAADPPSAAGCTAGGCFGEKSASAAARACAIRCRSSPSAPSRLFNRSSNGSPTPHADAAYKGDVGRLSLAGLRATEVIRLPRKQRGGGDVPTIRLFLGRCRVSWPTPVPGRSSLVRDAFLHRRLNDPIADVGGNVTRAADDFAVSARVEQLAVDGSPPSRAAIVSWMRATQGST